MTNSESNPWAAPSAPTPAEDPAAEHDPLEATRPLPSYRPERLIW
ncbi:hypothetical protein [Leucobacter rhizosphaerae]|nr:hypothetical protein [Leucobacter rhizosphaerae]